MNIRPCPHCGEPGKEVNPRGSEIRVRCENEICPMSFKPTLTLEQWNTRPIEDQLREAGLELLHLIDEHGDRVIKAHATTIMKARKDLGI